MCRHGFNLFINVNTFYIQINRMAGNPSPSHLFIVPKTLSFSSVLSHIGFSQDYCVAIFFLVKMIFFNCSSSCFWVVYGIHHFYFFPFTHCYLSLTSTVRVPWGSAWHILPTSSDVVKACPAAQCVRAGLLDLRHRTGKEYVRSVNSRILFPCGSQGWGGIRATFLVVIVENKTPDYF